MKQNRAAFPLVTALLFGNLPLIADETKRPAAPRNLEHPAAARQNIPEMIEADGQLRLSFGEERMVLPRGLAPFMLRTASGALVVQAQIPEKPFPTKRMVHASAMETRISRDDGATWTQVAE